MMLGKNFTLARLLLPLFFLLPSSLNAQNGKTAFLIHGFMGSPSDMRIVAARLEEEGYKTITADYETREIGIEAMADQVFIEALRALDEGSSLYIVTHSMGGLLARSYLERHYLDQLESMVMLAPPNHGSEVASELIQYELFGEFLGPAGAELGEIKLSPEKIGDYKLGIIAGTASVNPVFSRWLPGPDDGYVALESTPLQGMDDFISVPTSHGFITHNQSAINELVYFFEHGVFDHDMAIAGFPVSTEDFREIERFLDGLDEPAQ